MEVILEMALQIWFLERKHLVRQERGLCSLRGEMGLELTMIEGLLALPQVK